MAHLGIKQEDSLKTKSWKTLLKIVLISFSTMHGDASFRASTTMAPFGFKTFRMFLTREGSLYSITSLRVKVLLEINEVQRFLEPSRVTNSCRHLVGPLDSLPHRDLRPSSTVKKIVSLDNHIALACAGLKADARVLINRARIKCQSHKLTVEDPVTVEYITRYIAGLQQKYTQSGGVRPFGLSTLIVGFDPYSGVPSLYQTDPSGTFSAWKASATGRNSNSIREFLEKNYKETSGQETVKLAIHALLEVCTGRIDAGQIHELLSIQGWWDQCAILSRYPLF
ncbi:hypothetical protein Dimus_037042 [Dionaea muscipula]